MVFCLNKSHHLNPSFWTDPTVYPYFQSSCSCKKPRRPREVQFVIYIYICSIEVFQFARVICETCLNFRRSVGGLYYLSYLDRNMLLGRAVGGGGVFVFTRAQPLDLWGTTLACLIYYPAYTKLQVKNLIWKWQDGEWVAREMRATKQETDSPMAARI